MNSSFDNSFFENPFVKAHETILFPILKEIKLKDYFLSVSSNTVKLIVDVLQIKVKTLLLQGKEDTSLEPSLKKLTDILNEDSEIHMGKKYVFTLSNESLLQKQLLEFRLDLDLVKRDIDKLENDFIGYLEKSDIPLEIKKTFLTILDMSLNR